MFVLVVAQSLHISSEDVCVCVCEGGGRHVIMGGVDVGVGVPRVGWGVNVVCGKPSICLMIPEERELVLGTLSAVLCTCIYTHTQSKLHVAPPPPSFHPLTLTTASHPLP